MTHTKQNENDTLESLIDYFTVNPTAKTENDHEIEAKRISKLRKEKSLKKPELEPEKFDLNLFGGERLLALANRPKIDINFLVKKLHITPNEVIRIIGNPNSGKTYSALEIAIDSILGLPLFGNSEFQTVFDPNKIIVFLQLEGGKEMTRFRVERIVTGICEHYGFNHEETFKKVNERFFFQYMPASNVAFSNPSKMDKYKNDLAKQYKSHNVGQLFIDNQTAIFNTSGLSPNDPISRVILDCFKDAANMVSHDVFTWFIHHFNKNNIDAGSHQLFAASGTELNIHYEKDKNLRWIEHHKSNFTLSNDIPIEFTGNGAYDDDMECTRGLFIEAKDKSVIFAEEKQIVISQISSYTEPCNITSLIKTLVDSTKTSGNKISRDKATNLIKQMIETGEIVSEKGKNNSTIIKIKPINHGETSWEAAE